MNSITIELPMVLVRAGVTMHAAKMHAKRQEDQCIQVYETLLKYPLPKHAMRVILTRLAPVLVAEHLVEDLFEAIQDTILTWAHSVGSHAVLQWGYEQQKHPTNGIRITMEPSYDDHQ